MKIRNLELALALGDKAVQTHPHDMQLLKLADYIVTHPTSVRFHPPALRALGIDPDWVPSEHWSADVPTEAQGAEYMKAAIAYLNQQWHEGKLQRRVAVRALAWAATLLARRLDADCDHDCEQMVKAYGGSWAMIFRQHIAGPPTGLADLKDVL